MAASAGVHSVKFTFAMSGRASIGAQARQFQTETAAAVAPLPVVGVHGLWQLAPNWYLFGQAQYFSLRNGEYDGTLTNLHLGVSRMFGKHFELGAGWDTFTTRLGIDKARFNGDLKWRYSGAQIFVTAAF